MNMRTWINSTQQKIKRDHISHDNKLEEFNDNPRHQETKKMKLKNSFLEWQEMNTLD